MMDAVTPNYRSGKQAPDGPPKRQPDLTLVDILRQLHIEDPEVVATVLQRHGYRQPKRVHEYRDVVGMPMTAGLTDGDGELWSAASITEADFDKHGPWHLVHVPHVDDVENVPES